MILSVRAESIILSAPPAESMILSAPPERRWATPAAQWAEGREEIALGDGTAVARWTAQYRRSVRRSIIFLLQTCVFFAKVSHPLPLIWFFLASSQGLHPE